MDLPLADPNPKSPPSDACATANRVFDLGDPDCPFVEPLPKALADEVRRWRAESDRQVAEFDRMIAEARRCVESPEEVQRERRERMQAHAISDCATYDDKANQASVLCGYSARATKELDPVLLARASDAVRTARRRTEPEADRVDLAALFDRLRCAGIAPHRFGPEWDEAVVGSLSTSLPPSGDSCLRPNPAMGLNSVLLKHDDSSDNEESGGSSGGTDLRDRRGLPAYILKDLADLGAGFGRQLGPSDMLIESLFPDQVIPRPDVMLAEMTANLERFGNFTLSLLFAMTRDVALTPTLFTFGGGSALNDKQASDDEIGSSGVSYDQARAGKPGEQPALIIPSRQGWDPWYWDFDEPDDPSLKHYQRFALNLQYYEGSAGRSGELYMRRAAARKRLGLAAFAMGIGDYLARMESALGRALWQGINVIELGNEFDTYWQSELGSEEFGRFLALLAAPILMAAPGATLRAGELSSWHVNRYNLVGPNDQQRESKWQAKLEWLRHALAIGMGKEVQRWENVEDDWADALDGGFGLSLFAQEDLEAAIESGVFWPPIPEFNSRGQVTKRFTPSNKRRLLHQVGFHYYHMEDELPDAGNEPNTTYEGENRLINDAEQFEREVVSYLNGNGWNLTWSVCETSFPSQSSPHLDTVEHDFKPQSTQATEMMQAGVLARRLLTLRAKGAAIVAWHSWMALPKVEDPPSGLAKDWLLFSGSGVRVDIWPLTEDRWFAYRYAYPRSAWFTFRRVSWLLQRASSIGIKLRSNSGLVVLQLDSVLGSRFFLPSNSDSELDSPGECTTTKPYPEYRFCYVMWMDQATQPYETEGFSPSDSEKVILSGGSDTGIHQMSLVPEVQHPDLSRDANYSPPVNDKNYPSDFSVDWHWGGWDWADINASQDSISVTVLRAAPKGRPNPICLLTNLPNARIQTS